MASTRDTERMKDYIYSDYDTRESFYFKNQAYETNCDKDEEGLPIPMTKGREFSYEFDCSENTK